MKDIENNEAIKTDNVDENAKKQFLKGAEVAYEQIITYFAKGDKKSLKLFLLFIKSFNGAFCCPVPQTFLLLTRIYQHFNITKSSKVIG